MEWTEVRKTQEQLNQELKLKSRIQTILREVDGNKAPLRDICLKLNTLQREGKFTTRKRLSRGVIGNYIRKWAREDIPPIFTFTPRIRTRDQGLYALTNHLLK